MADQHEMGRAIWEEVCSPKIGQDGLEREYWFASGERRLHREIETDLARIGVTVVESDRWLRVLRFARDRFEAGGGEFPLSDDGWPGGLWPGDLVLPEDEQ